MTPVPQEHTLLAQDLPRDENIDLSDDAIVISGMSGMYPKSSNVQELSDILYNKVNPITSEGLRWNLKHPEAANYAGMSPGVERFDAQFFTIYQRLGKYLDPMARKLLEHSFQAIYDAGLCPADLSGKKIAVFVGSSTSDTETKGILDSTSTTGLGIIGGNKSMFANRISYWLNVKGPSHNIDEMDCSTHVALEQAIAAVKRGDCEAAIVGGASLTLNPHGSIYNKRLLAYPDDGKTKSFAANADGYVLSDTVGVLYIQKKKDALRVYAEVKHAKHEFLSLLKNNVGPKYGYDRNPQTTAEFIKRFYKEAQVSPQAVEYIEAHGTGMPDADKSELEAISEVFCKDRKEPLLVGSVTSNIGLTLAAAGHAGIVKTLLSFVKGELPGNLHCDQPREDVAALREGRMRVLTDHERFGRSYAAINGMSIGGVNSHILLQGHYKPKDLSRYKSAIPRLVTISGRQESAVQRIFDNLKSRTIDAEELALLHNIHSRNISGHLGRGYIILDSDDNNNTFSLCEKAEFYDGARRPLWFVYSGMGSQWAGMGTQLMRIPVFAAAIERCRHALIPKGLDIVDIITSPDKTMFDNILHSFVGIAAIQIGLTDILREIGLVPDGIIGHSVGELGCAYADGCLSAEEMILCAYSRGLASVETPLIRGSMAAVGLGYEQVSKMCPPEIDVACRNSADSSTISGPADKMRDFVAQLTAAGIFAREVPCSNIAYHSRYIKDAGPNLLKYLKEVIKNPKPRSERWVSTSVPQNKWDTVEAKHCSAEYQTNNLLSPVLFEETARLIPRNAILVEVAPHGLLQAILKRAMPADCLNVPLTKRGHPDNALFLLQAIGELYLNGYTSKVQAMYPKVEFPVSTQTPMLSHLVEWVHIETWEVELYADEQEIMSAGAEFIVSVHDEEHSYLRGNIIRGKTCYPYASALIAVWDTFAMSLSMPKRNISVQFRDLQFFAQPLLQDQRVLRLDINIHRGSGQFEVLNNNHSRIVSGYIFNEIEKTHKIFTENGDLKDMQLSSDDVYNLFADRDYSYEGEFRSIQCVDSSLCQAMLQWQDNWATLIDGLIQLNVLRQPHTGVSQPSNLRVLNINVKEHANVHEKMFNNKRVMIANIIENLDYTSCGGVSLQHISFRHLPSVSATNENLSLVIPPATKEFTAISQSIKTKNQVEKHLKPRITLQNSSLNKLETLNWLEAPQVNSSGLTVDVHYAGINMLDVKKATGAITNERNSYGMDYSGVIKSGDRVMGIVQSGAISTQIQAQPELLWPVPAHWTLEEAATVPLAYTLAFYCLKIKGLLAPGMSVVVHGGAGATGQAAIAILLTHNCRVFTTVSDVRKKQFLLKIFPQLSEDDVGNSRDSCFIDYVRQVKPLGCDIVLSCQKGVDKNVYMSCLGYDGRYIDLVQLPEREHYIFGMHNMAKAVMYFTVDIQSLFINNQFADMKLLRTMVSDGIAAGFVRPLTSVTYAPQDVTRAFRLLGANRHRGRVLLRMQENFSSLQPRIVCNPNQCHIIFWFNDALGVQLVERLISRGAKKIYIHIDNPTMYHQIKIESWKNRDIQVTQISGALTDRKHVTTLLNDIMQMGIIEGIYFTVDKSYGGNSKEYLTHILNNIDLSSRSLSPQLRYFAVISSDGQLSENVSLSRAANGYPSTSLDLSCLVEGYASETRIPVNLAIEAVERAICSPYPVIQAKKEFKQPLSMVHQIFTLADIEVRENTNAESTLRELGMAEEKIPIIKEFLSLSYNLSLSEHDVPLLTLNKINELEESQKEIIHPKVKGLATFFTEGSEMDLDNTADVILIPTLFREINKMKDELDVSQRYLCIIPGMEGHHGRFHKLCERLKLPALVLQTGIDHQNESVPEMGRRLAEMMMVKSMAQDNFYLLGYEAGTLVALEMAAILEDNGYKGTIFLLGYDPEEFLMELEEQLSELATEEQLEDALVRHVSKLLTGEDLPELDNALKNSSTWAEKVEAGVNSMRGRITHSNQYTRAFLETALPRIKQVQKYKPVPRQLRSRLVLLRAASKHAAHDYVKALQRHSSQDVSVHQLSAPLSYAALDMQSSAIVNKYLDAEILSVFENQSHCRFYEINQRLTLD